MNADQRATGLHKTCEAVMAGNGRRPPETGPIDWTGDRTRFSLATVKIEQDQIVPKSAREKLAASKPTRRVRLDKNFAGAKAGELLFVASPIVVADYMRSIPRGQTKTVSEMRADLAQTADCDSTCPISTAIFARVAAEAALEDLEDGLSTAEVTPFWRLIGPEDKIAGRLPVDRQWIADRRAAEA